MAIYAGFGHDEMVLGIGDLILDHRGIMSSALSPRPPSRGAVEFTRVYSVTI